jgi:hypothetical protein
VIYVIILSRLHRRIPAKHRKPSKLTLAVTGSTVLAAAAAASVVMLWPANSADAGSSLTSAQVNPAAGQRALWNVESGWNVTAANPSSGAYGIPQALPGSKMASAGADWQTNAATQIRWGLGYIKSVYGSPCAAWGHEQVDGWY